MWLMPEVIDLKYERMYPTGEPEYLPFTPQKACANGFHPSEIT